MEPAKHPDTAVARLATEDGQALVTFAYLLCADTEESQDIVQTVLARLLTSSTFARAEVPLAYARRAITNEFLDRRRRRDRLARVLTVLRSEPRTVPPQDVRIADRDALSRAFGVLNARERSAVVLRYYEAWDEAAIADALGCAPATVRSLISRAIRKLRQALGTADESGEAR